MTALDRACAAADEAARRALRQVSDPARPLALELPDVGPACEVLLADQLFHDLRSEERERLLERIEAEQSESGIWLSPSGSPDLSLTCLAWWACVQNGRDPEMESLRRAQAAILELGGAQGAEPHVRFWLALAGKTPWTWLPIVPAELWLLPDSVPLAPTRLSVWARSVLAPYHLLASTPARLHLADPSPILRKTKDGKAETPPRMTEEGLAGNLLEAVDKTLKLSRKLPRGPLHKRSVQRSLEWVQSQQQAHGGWHSLRPTLYSLMALRAAGLRSDDPAIARGLAYLRDARAFVTQDQSQQCQQLWARPLALSAQLEWAAGEAKTARYLANEMSEPGEWQLRADVEVGGWPREGQDATALDVDATCDLLEVLQAQTQTGASNGTTSPTSPTSPAWAAMRRSSHVLLAMQEADGAFARFERGERRPPGSRLPWRDAFQLAWSEPAADRIERSAKVIHRLAHQGWRKEDDRIRRALKWTQDAVESTRKLELKTKAEVLRAWTAQGLGNSDFAAGLRRDLESADRSSVVELACALRALSEAGSLERGQPLARELAQLAERDHLAASARRTGVGLSRTVEDRSAGERLSALALRQYREKGGEL